MYVCKYAYPAPLYKPTCMAQSTRTYASPATSHSRRHAPNSMAANLSPKSFALILKASSLSLNPKPKP